MTKQVKIVWGVVGVLLCALVFLLVSGPLGDILFRRAEEPTLLPQYWDEEYGDFEALMGGFFEEVKPEYYDLVDFNSTMFDEEFPIHASLLPAVIALMEWPLSPIPAESLERYFTPSYYQHVMAMRHSSNDPVFGGVSQSHGSYDGILMAISDWRGGVDTYFVSFISGGVYSDFYIEVIEGKVQPQGWGD